MKLLSYNICIKIDNTNEVIKFLKEKNADIITLQESVRAFDNTVFDKFNSANPIEKSFKETHKYSFFAPIYIADAITKSDEVHLDFGGKVEQGTQLISKNKIISGENKFYYNEYRYGFDATDFRKSDWTRSIGVNVIKTDNGKLVKIINVHGLWAKDKLDNDETIKQGNFILEEAKKYNLPVIIVGDFNLLPECESIRLLSSKFKNLCDEYNIKTTRPQVKGHFVCDYIFVSDEIEVKDFEVINTDISDHLPLILDFDVK